MDGDAQTGDIVPLQGLSDLGLITHQNDLMAKLSSRKDTPFDHPVRRVVPAHGIDGNFQCHLNRKPVN